MFFTWHNSPNGSFKPTKFLLAKVKVALDAELMESEPLNFHPLDNAMTTSVSARGLLSFLADVDHEPRMVRFPDELASW